MPMLSLEPANLQKHTCRMAFPASGLLVWRVLHCLLMLASTRVCLRHAAWVPGTVHPGGAAYQIPCLPPGSYGCGGTG